MRFLSWLGVGGGLDEDCGRKWQLAAGSSMQVMRYVDVDVRRGEEGANE